MTQPEANDPERAARYKALRETIGTQEEVAALLGIARLTIARREVGIVRVTREAELALQKLCKHAPAGIRGRKRGRSL